MLQFYFLAVICTVLTGLYFACTEYFSGRIPKNARIPVLDTAFVLCAVTGILKLFLVVQPDIVILGDLMPALGCLIAAFCLFLELYEQQFGKSLSLPSFFLKIAGPGTDTGSLRKYLGIVLIVIGVLHFFIPAVRVF